LSLKIRPIKIKNLKNELGFNFREFLWTTV
jgi:hypothetical protein